MRTWLNREGEWVSEEPKSYWIGYNCAITGLPIYNDDEILRLREQHGDAWSIVDNYNGELIPSNSQHTRHHIYKYIHRNAIAAIDLLKYTEDPRGLMFYIAKYVRGNTWKEEYNDLLYGIARFPLGFDSLSILLIQSHWNPLYENHIKDLRYLVPTKYYYEQLTKYLKLSEVLH